MVLDRVEESFCGLGKDFNKVDRLGGLLARQLAFRSIREEKASDALVTLEYVPGCDGPVSIGAIIDGNPIDIDEQKFLAQPFLKNKRVSRRFNRIEFKLTELARWGHQTAGVPWEFTWWVS